MGDVVGVLNGEVVPFVLRQAVKGLEFHPAGMEQDVALVVEEWRSQDGA